MSQKYLLGSDLGTSGTKTVLFAQDGLVVASATVEYPMYQPQNGWAEQAPEDWWNAAVATLSKVVRDSGVPDPVNLIPIGAGGVAKSAGQAVFRGAVSGAASNLAASAVTLPVAERWGEDVTWKDYALDAVFGADFLLPLETKGLAKIFYKSSAAGKGAADSVHAFSELHSLLPRADIVALTCPLTRSAQRRCSSRRTGTQSV